MNLYRSLGRIWSGTQAAARAASALDGDKDFEHIDVPTDKAGLLQFLNSMEQRLADTVSTAAPEYFPIEEDDDQPTPAGTYQNGDPTSIFNKSRNPEAIFNCTSCGHQNRNQGQ